MVYLHTRLRNGELRYSPSVLIGNHDHSRMMRISEALNYFSVNTIISSRDENLSRSWQSSSWSGSWLRTDAGLSNFLGLETDGTHDGGTWKIDGGSMGTCDPPLTFLDGKFSGQCLTQMRFESVLYKIVIRETLNPSLTLNIRIRKSEYFDFVPKD